MQTFSAPTESTAPRRCGGRFLRSRRTLRTCHCHCLPKAPLRRASSPRTVTAPFVSRCLDSLTRCPTALRKARMQAALRGRSRASGKGRTPARPHRAPQPLLARPGISLRAPALRCAAGRRLLAAPSSRQPEAPPRSPGCTLQSEGERRQMSLIQGEGQCWHDGKAACALCQRLETFLKIHCSSVFLNVLILELTERRG